MGRRVNIPQPLVLNTELSALTLSFHVSGDDALEQWYYANTNEYLPDRSLYPLTLTPSATGYDPDTSTTHTLAFSSVRWYEVSDNGEGEIINTYDTSDVEYVIDGFSLVVKKNVLSSASVAIRCVAIYIDPRDNATLGQLEESVILRTNRDATTVFPTIIVDTPKQQTWNPLSTDSSLFTFNARVLVQKTDITNNIEIVWRGVDVINGVASQETNIEDMPSYVSGQGTDTLVVDAKYSEHLTIVCRARENTSSDFFKSSVSKTLSWKEPTLSSVTYSPQGASVRVNTENMTFETIINVRNSVLQEDIKRENLAMLWKMRIPTSTIPSEREEKSIGWGQRVSVDGIELFREDKKTIMIYPYIYLIGAQRVVTYNGEVVTHNGATITERETN